MLADWFGQRRCAAQSAPGQGQSEQNQQVLRQEVLKKMSLVAYLRQWDSPPMISLQMGLPGLAGHRNPDRAHGGISRERRRCEHNHRGVEPAAIRRQPSRRAGDRAEHERDRLPLDDGDGHDRATVTNDPLTCPRKPIAIMSQATPSVMGPMPHCWAKNSRVAERTHEQ